MNEETRNTVENPVTKVLRDGHIVGLANHTLLIARNSEECAIDDSAAPIRDASGNIAGVVMVFRDNTASRQTEEAIRASNAASLRANNDLKHFAFAASHDLQEPLRVITSYSQLLVRDFAGDQHEDAAQYVGFITEGTKKMRELLTDLLAYTRLTNSEQESIELINLNEVLERTLDTYQATTRDSQATVTSGNLPTISAHLPHMVQPFQNLIGNALKYRGP